MKPESEIHAARLAACAKNLAECSVRNLFDTDPERYDAFSLDAAGIHLDFSKQRLDRDALASLLALADSAGLAAATRAMYAGDAINFTEGRAVLHTALRLAIGEATVATPHAREIRAVHEQLASFVDEIRNGTRRGYSGEAFTDVVNIGIGGSHLGPQLACDALRYAAGRQLRTHFLANVDGGEFDRIIGPLNPQTTLFIVASKSFTTVETRLNATSARAWLAADTTDPTATGKHFVAVSANVERATSFGIDKNNVFPMWDWVGGRYSMWSAIGLPIALQFGMTVFDELLAGAAAMDRHFLTAPLSNNLPALLALVGIWNTNFLGAESCAVIPYDDRLRYLPDYLQQLEMESNGKRVSNTNTVLSHHSAPITWGGLGTNAQHAFFQLLHQGTRLVPVDFIVALHHPVAPASHHDMLVANCFAQAEGLMNGTPPAGAADIERDPLLVHRATPGNRPTTMLTFDELTPATLGALIALYEHKTFAQSVIWDINAFDQWGVELGKHLATAILDEVSGAGPALAHDPSTRALIERYRAKRNA